MAAPLIGILGAYGAVGRAATRWLRASGTVRLRVGGRRADALDQLVANELGGAAESRLLDVYDDDALGRFCAGCRVVVHCAGPSSSVQDRVARVAFAAGADYVDPGGDDVLFARLVAIPGGDTRWTAVIGAGLLPGVSGLIPRWLAGPGFDRVEALTAFICVRDRFTPAAAADYLLSVGGNDGESLAVWRHARRVTRGVQPLIQIELPHFRSRVNAYPFFSREAERLARALGLRQVSWYHVFDDDQVVSLISRVRTEAETIGLVTASEALAHAIDLELFGRPVQQLFVYHLDGARGGVPCRRTAIFRADGTYEVSGFVAALTVDSLLRDAVAPGVHFAAMALDPHWFAERLLACPAVASLGVLEATTAADTIADEEGAL